MAGDKRNGSKKSPKKFHENRKESYHFYGPKFEEEYQNNNSPSSPTSLSKHHKSLNATDDESIRELFKPVRSEADSDDYSDYEYDLRKAHQRANVAMDKHLGENNVQAGIDHLGPLRWDGYIEAVSWASCFIIRASLTLEKSDITTAREAVAHSSKMCKKFMKGGIIENIQKMIMTPNYDKYTDVEVYAQVYWSQSFALGIALHAMETNSVFTLIKLAYHLRGLVRAYGDCWKIMKTRTVWESQEAQRYFEAHMRFTNGIINIVVSHTPPKFLRIMNFLGYKGSESVGLNEMNRAAFEIDAGFTSKLAQLFLIYYWVYAKPHVENIPGDLSLCKQLVEAELELFPNSMLYGLAKAKIEQIDGNFDTAIETLNTLLTAPNLEVAHKSFYFELIWCHAIKLDWKICIEYADKIRSSKHSPVCTAYLGAVFRYVQGVDTNNEELLEQASQEFAVIPSLRIRQFGKTMTTEKAALCNAVLFFKKGKHLVLPAIAMLYSGNYLSFIRRTDELERLHARCETQVERFRPDLENSDSSLDDYLTALFYKGVMLRLMKKLHDAKECFESILDKQDRIDLETSIVPMATFELGYIQMELGNPTVAQEWLEKAEKDYTGYTAENFVHLRVYATLRKMGHKTDKELVDKDKLNKHISQWLKYHEIDFKSYKQIITSD